jgi:hypothetical protein
MADTLYLDVTGSTLTINDHEANGVAHWDVVIRVQAPIQIVRTVLVECGHGGYAFSVTDETPVGTAPTLFGQGPGIAADTPAKFDKSHAEPLACMVVYCLYIDSQAPGIEKVALITLPVSPHTTLTWASTIEDAPMSRAVGLPDAAPRGDVARGVFLTAMAPVAHGRPAGGQEGTL